MMADYLDSSKTISLTIPEAVNKENITQYMISVSVGSVKWTVLHRYSEFVELHESLIEAGVTKESLPPKKIIGNKDPSFIMKRRKDLESYIQSVFHFLEKSLPQALADFLDFPKYDVNYILRQLASNHYDFVEAEKEHEKQDLSMSPLELHAISERLKKPRPPQDTDSKRYDFTNVADFCCQLKSLLMVGSKDPLGTSNIIPNSLKFDFLAFKSLTTLQLQEIDCCADKVTAIGMVRNTLTHLQVNHCGLTCIADILLCDTVHKLDSEDYFNDRSYEWKALENLDLRSNVIQEIDPSISLCPNIRTLFLSGNKITKIENLTGLPALRTLDLSGNAIADTDGLNTRLGQITTLMLAHNNTTSLEGFSKLYSLIHLDVSGNRIKELQDVVAVAKLPCLEALNLQGNRVTTIVDYRLKVLEAFGKRCSDLCLDNESASQSEVDKVSILMALRVAKEGKSPTSLFGNLPRRV